MLNTIYGSLRKKLQFKSPSVTFMGHKLTHKGVELDSAKVATIRDMPVPTDKASVQRFLGMCQYLSKFSHNLSETVLRSLIKDDSVSLWSESHETAFNSAKRPIALTTALPYYDPHLPVTLQVDYAIGGVLLQEGRPVCFTSHTLSNIERNCAQIQKECLSIVSCMDKWHYYLYGKHDITVHSDHQPLETIFKKPLSRAPRRLQRMMLKLQKYQFKKGKELFIADTLSRSATSVHDYTTATVIQECKVFRVELAQMDLAANSVTVETMNQIREDTSKDSVLAVLH